MALPQAVKKAAAQADELHKQVYTQPTVEETAAVEDPAPEDPVAEDTVEETPVEEPTPAPVAKDATEATWEQRYKTLQGMWKKDMPTLQSENQGLKARLVEIEQKLNSVETEKPADPAPEIQKFITDEDREEYGDDLLSVVRRAAKEELMPELTQVHAENTRLRQQLDGVGSTLVQTERQRVLSAMDGRVPGWRDINQSPEFVDWLNQSDPYSGQKKHDMLINAFENNDLERMIAFFSGFQGELAAISPEGTATTRAPQVNVDKLVSPGTPRTGGGNSRATGGDKDTRIWTEAEIKAFYQDVTAGRYRSAEKQKIKNRIEAEIHRAANENRVRQAGHQPSSF